MSSDGVNSNHNATRAEPASQAAADFIPAPHHEPYFATKAVPDGGYFVQENQTAPGGDTGYDCLDGHFIADPPDGYDGIVGDAYIDESLMSRPTARPELLDDTDFCFFRGDMMSLPSFLSSSPPPITAHPDIVPTRVTTDDVDGGPDVRQSVTDLVPGVCHRDNALAPNVHENVIASAPDVHQSVIASAPDVHQSVIASAPDVHQSVIASAPDVHQSVIASAPDVHQSVIASAPDVSASFSESVPNLHLNVTESVPNVQQNDIQLVPDVHQSVTESAPDVHRNVFESVPDVHQSVTESVPDVHQSVTEPVPDVHQSVSEPVPDVHQSVTEPVPDVHQSVTEPMPDVHQSVTEPVPDVHQSVAEPVPDVHQSVTEPVPDVHQSVAEPVPDVHQSVTEHVPDVHQTVAESLPDLHQSVTDSVPDVHQRVTEPVPDLHRGVTESSSDSRRRSISDSVGDGGRLESSVCSAVDVTPDLHVGPLIDPSEASGDPGDHLAVDSGPAQSVADEFAALSLAPNGQSLFLLSTSSASSCMSEDGPATDAAVSVDSGLVLDVVSPRHTDSIPITAEVTATDEVDGQTVPAPTSAVGFAESARTDFTDCEIDAYLTDVCDPADITNAVSVARWTDGEVVTADVIHGDESTTSADVCDAATDRCGAGPSRLAGGASNGDDLRAVESAGGTAASEASRPTVNGGATSESNEAEPSGARDLVPAQCRRDAVMAQGARPKQRPNSLLGLSTPDLRPVPSHVAAVHPARPDSEGNAFGPPGVAGTAPPDMVADLQGDGQAGHRRPSSMDLPGRAGLSDDMPVQPATSPEAGLVTGDGMTGITSETPVPGRNSASTTTVI